MMDSQTTRDRLINWARWSRSGRGGPATCMSLEGRYVRPSLIDREDEGAREPKAAPIDTRDALLVYRAVNPVNGFPKKWSLALTAEFILRLEQRQFQGYLRRHGCGGTSGRDLAQLVADAVLGAGNAIYRAELARSVKPHYHSDNLTSDTDSRRHSALFASDRPGDQ